MIKAKYPMKLGDKTIEIEVEGETQVEIFKELSYWMSLPNAGPNGEQDLQLVHRVVEKDKKKFTYCTILTRKGNKEFQLGQCTDPVGYLFPKKWVTPQRDLDRVQEEDDQSDTSNTLASVEDVSGELRRQGCDTQAKALDKIELLIGKRALPAELTPQERGKLYGELKRK